MRLLAHLVDRRPIVWIGGGRAKGGDVEAFAHQVGTRIDIAIIYGEVVSVWPRP